MKKTIFAMTLVAAFAAQADEPRQAAPRQQSPYADCADCEPPPPRYYNPRANYACDQGCAAPVVPYPNVVLAPLPPPVIITAPPVYPVPCAYGAYGCGYGGYGGYGPPRWGGYPGYGYGPRPTPYYGGGGGTVFMPRPGGPVHRMSAQSGCEVQQGNNGEFAVITPMDKVIYLDDSAHAEANAGYMKAYYESGKTGLCSAPSVQPSKSLDI